MITPQAFQLGQEIAITGGILIAAGFGAKYFWKAVLGGGVILLIIGLVVLLTNYV